MGDVAMTGRWGTTRASINRQQEVASAAAVAVAINRFIIHRSTRLASSGSQYFLLGLHYGRLDLISHQSVGRVPTLIYFGDVVSPKLDYNQSQIFIDAIEYTKGEEYGFHILIGCP
jgi:hypothetical protein